MIGTTHPVLLLRIVVDVAFARQNCRDRQGGFHHLALRWRTLVRSSPATRAGHLGGPPARGVSPSAFWCSGLGLALRRAADGSCQARQAANDLGKTQACTLTQTDIQGCTCMFSPARRLFDFSAITSGFPGLHTQADAGLTEPMICRNDHGTGPRGLRWGGGAGRRSSGLVEVEVAGAGGGAGDQGGGVGCGAEAG